MTENRPLVPGRDGSEARTTDTTSEHGQIDILWMKRQVGTIHDNSGTPRPQEGGGFRRCMGISVRCGQSFHGE